MATRKCLLFKDHTLHFVFWKVKKNVSVLQEMDTLLLDLNLELTPLNEMQFWKKASKYFKIWIFYFLFLKKKE